MIFATQSLSDIMESSIISTIIESCPTRIFLPNKKAFEKSIRQQYLDFGLNERQLEILAYSIPKQEYYCQSSEGNRKFKLELKDKTLALCGSSSQKDIRKMKALKKENQDNNRLVNDFLKYKNVAG